MDSKIEKWIVNYDVKVGLTSEVRKKFGEVNPEKIENQLYNRFTSGILVVDKIDPKNGKVVFSNEGVTRTIKLSKLGYSLQEGVFRPVK
jgi:hypothetical protein